MKPLINDITIEITNHCQLHCQHCGIWAEKERHEMTASMVLRTMHELLQRYKIKFVSITGGEPFLNRNCGRVLKAMALLKEKKEISGFGVYTNAAYFEGIRRVFITQGPQLKGMQMGISIDGREETHDILRGPGEYKKSLKTIKWLHENFGQDIVLELKFTINSLNYGQVEDVYRLAKYFNARFSPKIMESGVSDYYHRHELPNTDALATLTPKMVEQVQTQMTRIFAENYPGIDRELSSATLVLLAGGRTCIKACETPAKSLFINSRREVYPCLYMKSSGKLGSKGELPKDLDLVREELAKEAIQGHCPGCFAYHGFLKKFNLQYLQQ